MSRPRIRDNPVLVVQILRLRRRDPPVPIRKIEEILNKVSKNTIHRIICDNMAVSGVLGQDGMSDTHQNAVIGVKA